ncbi:MAG TPA: lysophospholipid acyltransferase family protein [Polyangiales bacterium]|nr:lysophospholipid acyltransferase family protein [Polyangiales bacterium]
MNERPRTPRMVDAALTAPRAGDTSNKWFKAFTDAVISLSSRITGEDLDEQLSRTLPVRTLNEIGVDPFGIDIDTTRLSIAMLVYLHRYWFRTEVHGLANVPTGRVLLVGNHSGQVPLDGVVIALAMALDSENPRFPRAMIERFINTLPFFSVWFPRVGQVLGTPENARHLLEKEDALIIFPEGVKGISKTISERYKLAPFGPGFMRLALQTRSPIVPVAVIGAEEQYPSVADFKSFARLVGLPSLPIIPQLFFGFLAPLPTKYRLYFGEPLYFSGDPDDDDAAIDEKVWVVQATIQSMVNRGVKERKAIFW